MDGKSGWEAYREILHGRLKACEENISGIQKDINKNHQEVIEALTTLKVGFKYQSGRISAVVAGITSIIIGIVIGVIVRWVS